MVAETHRSFEFTKAQRHARARAAVRDMGGDTADVRKRLSELVLAGFRRERQRRLAEGHADQIADFRDAIMEIARLADWAERLRKLVSDASQNPEPELSTALAVAALIDSATAGLFNAGGVSLPEVLEQAHALERQILQAQANREALDTEYAEQRALEVAALSIVAHHDIPAYEPVNGLAPPPGVIEPIDWIVVDGCGTDSKALEDALVAAHGHSLGRDLFDHLVRARQQFDRLAEHRADTLSMGPERGGSGSWDQDDALGTLGYPRVCDLDEAAALLKSVLRPSLHGGASDETASDRAAGSAVLGLGLPTKKQIVDRLNNTLGILLSDGTWLGMLKRAEIVTGQRGRRFQPDELRKLGLAYDGDKLDLVRDFFSSWAAQIESES